MIFSIYTILYAFSHTTAPSCFYHINRPSSVIQLVNAPLYSYGLPCVLMLHWTAIPGDGAACDNNLSGQYNHHHRVFNFENLTEIIMFSQNKPLFFRSTPYCISCKSPIIQHTCICPCQAVNASKVFT